jgi:hypothetical protein
MAKRSDGLKITLRLMSKKKFIAYLIGGTAGSCFVAIVILLVLACKTAFRAEVNIQGLKSIEMSLEDYLAAHHNEWPRDWSFLIDEIYNKDYIRANYKLRGVNAPDNMPEVVLYPKPIFQCEHITRHIEELYSNSIRPTAPNTVK